MEHDLRSQLLDRNDAFQSMVIEQVESAERLVGSRADLILTCSTEDAEKFSDHYGWPLSSIELVPNGVFVNDFNALDLNASDAARSRIGLNDRAIAAFFIGSNYGPNIGAAEMIVHRIAPNCPDVTFVIAGGVCDSLPRDLPQNIRSLGNISDEARRDWLTASDIGLNPMLSGSGTNIKMFEYAAASLPIVTTAIGARGIVETSSYGINVCEVEEMQAIIMALATDRTLRNSAGASNRQLVEDYFSWEKLSRDLGRLLSTEVLNSRGRQIGQEVKSNKMRIGHFSTVGQKCGIGEYTQHLIDSMSAIGHENMVFTCDMPGSTPDVVELGSRAVVAWFNDNVRYRDSTLHGDIDAIIAESGVQFAIIQHHPAFLPPNEVCRLARTFGANGAHVAVVMHTYDRAQAGLVADLNAMYVPVFSHKKRDIIEAAKHGISLFHLPLAIPMPSGTWFRTTPRNIAAPVIVSNGFLREHKGITRLIEAFSLVQKEIPGARLKLHCSLYPSDDSKRAKQEAVQAIASLGLETSVELDTNYHEKDTLLRAIAQADIAVFPYGNSAEGGSAAVADAIAMGLPVIVSQSPIFDDVRPIALTCTTEPREIAEALLEVLRSRERYSSLALRSQAYAERNSWQRVIDTLMGVI